jgi:hypothetical protein
MKLGFSASFLMSSLSMGSRFPSIAEFHPFGLTFALSCLSAPLFFDQALRLALDLSQNSLSVSSKSLKITKDLPFCKGGNGVMKLDPKREPFVLPDR